jgi:hypothetical protein
LHEPIGSNKVEVLLEIRDPVGIGHAAAPELTLEGGAVAECVLKLGEALGHASHLVKV